MKGKKVFATIVLMIFMINILLGFIYGVKANVIDESFENEIQQEKVINNVDNKDDSKLEDKNNIKENIINDTNEIESIKKEENVLVEESTVEAEEKNNIVEKEEVKQEEIIEEKANKEVLKEEIKEQETVYSANGSEVGVTYRTHVQNDGWQNWKTNGQMSGTQGKSYRLEGINIKLEGNTNFNIKYKVHVQNEGWQSWKTNGEMSGTQGKSYRLEAIKIQLDSSDDYSVMYRVHVQNIGWQGWKYDGEMAGTEGKSYRLEGIEIKIVPKVKKAKLSIDVPQNNSTYYTPNNIKVYGWKMANVSNSTIKAYLDGATTPIDAAITYKKRNDVISAIEGYGTALQNENAGFEFFINGTELTNGKHTIKIIVYSEKSEVLTQSTTSFKIDRNLHVEYRAHVQNIGWQGYALDGNLSGTEGKSYRVEAMNINLINVPSNAKITYRTHIQNVGWQSWKSNGEMSGTQGKGLRVEALQIKLENMDDYTVEYKAHVQNVGWTDWYIDGETAGTVGKGLRIEAIKIRIVSKYKRSYKGIDVSVYNGSINWGQVKASGIDFAMIRVGFRGYGKAGSLNLDKNFEKNMDAANRLGIPVGVYFVTQAITPEEAIEEANWVINKIKKYKISYPVAIDIEAPGLESPTDVPRTQNLDRNTRSYLAHLFCQTIQNNGYVPIIYCNVDWATNYLNMNDLAFFDTWIASYRKSGPGYNGKYSIWQYTSSGSVSGIIGNVDMNYCYKKY